MITFYRGTNGSGKSYHVAHDIYERLKKGGLHGNVIATFPIAIEQIKKQKGNFTYCNVYELTPQFLTDYAEQNHNFDLPAPKFEGQTLVIIDEAQRIFNPRDYNIQGRRAWLDWLPEHRHFGFDIIMISPMEKMIDKQIRGLWEYEVVHRKANNFGFIGSLLTLFGIKAFFAITYWYGVKEKCGTDVMFANNKYFRIYNSLQRFGKKSDQQQVASICAAVDGAAAPVGGPVTVAQVEAFST